MISSKFKWLFLFTLLIIVVLNLYLLRSYFGYGLVNEDWQYIVAYKIVNLDILSKYFYFWREVGPRGGYYIFYLGLIDQIFPKNYELIQIINFSLKIIATISLFPVIWVITKDKILAFLSVLFFGISFSAAGLLTYAATGVEYLGIIFINLLVVSYYYFWKTRKVKYFLFSFLFLNASLLTAYLRSLPIFLIIVIFEVLMIKNKKTLLKDSLIRMLILILPSLIMFIGISRQISNATQGSLYDTSRLTDIFLLKNWYHFISPISGIGFQFISTKDIQLFGSWDLIHFSSFIKYIFPRIFLLLSFLSILIIRLIAPKHKSYFFLLIFLDGVFLLLLFGLITSFRFLFPTMLPSYDFGSQLVAFFAAIIGSFVLSTSLVSGLVWLKEKRNNISLFLVFISPLLSFLFILFPWVYAGIHFTFEGGIHRYLAVPALGISIFLAALVNLGIKNKSKWKIVDCVFMILVIVFCFVTAQKELSYYFDIYRSLGVDIKAQRYIQDKFYNTFIKDKDNLLIYFEQDTKPTANTLYWERALEFGHLPDWVYLDKYYQSASNESLKNCVAIVPDYDRLEKSVRVVKNDLEFSLVTLCKEDLNKNLAGNYIGISNRVFKESEFLAFTIKDGKIINISETILNRLKMKLAKANN